MKPLRPLDPGIALCLAFTLAMGLSAWLTIALLGELGRMSQTLQSITAPGLQKLSSGTIVAINKGAGVEFASARMWVILCLVGNFALVVVLVLWLRAGIARPLRQAAAMARRVRDGDLRGAPCPDTAEDGAAGGKDAAGDLLLTMQEMNVQLAGRIAQLRGGTDELALRAGTLAADSRHLALHGDRHSAALEETATTLAELHVRIRQYEAQAAGALTGASGSASILAGMDAPLAALLATTGRIAGIVDTIDDIAFRTTVLALNTAVEAARTGEADGFATVATRIGALAQRSALAAREIKALIEDAGQQRACLADHANQAMQDVTSSVQQLGTLVNSMQALGTTGLGSNSVLCAAIATINHAGQEQALLADENASAAAHLRDQAGSLSRLVDSFLLAPPHAQPAPRIALVASNPGKLSTPARAVRSDARVVRVNQERRGGGLH